MAYVTFIDAYSSIVKLVSAWGSDPGGRYWGPGSSKFSFQDYLVRVMLENFLRCHYFARLKFYCAESSECSSTQFLKFTGTMPLQL